MAQPQNLSTIIGNGNANVANISTTCSSALPTATAKAREYITKKYPSFIQSLFAARPLQCYMGNAPTLARVGRECYDEFAVAWLCKQIHEYVKTLSTADQLRAADIQNLALVIYSAYPSLNLDEVMLFFSRLAAGIYGIVGYNSVRGENITARIRQFLEDRRREIERYERERERMERAAEDERRRKYAVSREAYKQMLATLAAERFGGDEDKAREYIATHPEEFQLKNRNQ
nr:MAG TPA: hypothetical protein [Caudoviricetes sp.]